MVGFGGPHDTGPDLSRDRVGVRDRDDRKMSQHKQLADAFTRNRGGDQSRRETAYNDAQRSMAKRGDTKAMEAYQRGLEAGDERFGDMAEDIHGAGWGRSLADMALRGLVPGLGPEFAGVNEAGDPTVAREFDPIGLAASMAGPIPGGLMRGMAKAMGGNDPVQIGMTAEQMAQQQALTGGAVARDGQPAPVAPSPGQGGGGGGLARMMLARMFGGGFGG